MPRVVFALWVACAAFSAAPSLRAESRTVVMRVDGEATPLGRRLEQEIESLGLAVRIISSSEASLDAAAAGAVATIHVKSTSGGDVDLTIVDAATHRTTTWKLVAPQSLEPADAELIPTRTVELLRASLLELTAKRAPPPAPKPAPPSPKPEASGSELSLLLGPGAIYTARFRPGATLQGTITWLPSRHVGLAASVLAPLVAAKLTSPQGSVELDARLFRLGPVWVIGERHAPVTLRLGAGAQLEQLRFSGQATATYLSASSTRSAWSPFISVTPRFRLARALHAIAELAVGSGFPTTTVRLAGRDVIDWGRPWGTAQLGLELSWDAREGASP